MDTKYLTLPPVNVSRCSAAAANNTLLWQQSIVDADWTTASLSAHQLDITNATIHVIIYVFRVTSMSGVIFGGYLLSMPTEYTMQNFTCFQYTAELLNIKLQNNKIK